MLLRDSISVPKVGELKSFPSFIAGRGVLKAPLACLPCSQRRTGGKQRTSCCKALAIKRVAICAFECGKCGEKHVRRQGSARLVSSRKCKVAPACCVHICYPQCAASGFACMEHIEDET